MAHKKAFHAQGVGFLLIKVNIFILKFILERKRTNHPDNVGGGGVGTDKVRRLPLSVKTSRFVILSY